MHIHRTIFKNSKILWHQLLYQLYSPKLIIICDIFRIEIRESNYSLINCRGQGMFVLSAFIYSLHFAALMILLMLWIKGFLCHYGICCKGFWDRRPLPRQLPRSGGSGFPSSSVGHKRVDGAENETINRIASYRHRANWITWKVSTISRKFWLDHNEAWVPTTVITGGQYI